MFKKLTLFLPYLVFLSLPLVAWTKGKGTVIMLLVLCLGIWAPAFSSPSISDKIKDYKKPLFWGLLCLLWCGLSILWAEGPWTEILLRYVRLIGLLVIGYTSYFKLTTASTDTQNHIYRAFTLGYAVYLVFYILAITTNGFTHGYNEGKLLRGVVTLSFLLWPFLGIIKNKLAQIAFLGGFLWLIYGIGPDAAFLAMLIASIIYFSPLWLQKVSLAGMLIGGTAMPWISKYLLNEHMLFDYMRFIPISYQHRILMWEELSDRIFEKPIWGHGFDFSVFIKSPTSLCTHYVTEVIQTYFKDLKNLTPLTTYPGGGTICLGDPLLCIHPHNGFLQIWLELGAIGILLFSVLVIMFYRSIQHNKLAVAMFSFYAVIFSISFNIWQNWMIATLWLGSMCLFVVNHKQKHPI